MICTTPGAENMKWRFLVEKSKIIWLTCSHLKKHGPYNQNNLHCQYNVFNIYPYDRLRKKFMLLDFLLSIFATLVPWVNKYTQVMTTIKVTKVWDKVCIPPGKSQVYFRRKMKVIDIDYTCGNLPFTHFIPNFCDLNGGHYLSLFVHSGHQISKYRGQKQQQKWFILKLWYCYVLKNWIPQPGLF